MLKIFRETYGFFFQVHVQKLNRASRLLLGALVEAFEVLNDLQRECGEEESVNNNVEIVRELLRRQSPLSSSSATSSVISNNQQTQGSLPENNELTVTTTDQDNHEMDKDQKQPKDKTDCKVVSTPEKTVSEISTFTLPDIVHCSSNVKLCSPNTRSQLPDLVPSIVKRRVSTPRKRRPFRLSTLRQTSPTPTINQTKDKTPEQRQEQTKHHHHHQQHHRQNNWSESGARLRDVSRTWDSSPGHHQSLIRRPSLPALRHNPDLMLSRPLSSSTPRRHSTSPWSDLMRSVLDSDSPDGPNTTRTLVNTVHNNDSDQLINNVLKAVQVFGLFLIIRKFENMLK